MPLTLLRGRRDRSRAPAIPPGADDAALTDAYLRFFEREARWPGRSAETDLIGTDTGVSVERSLKIAVRAASIFLRGHEADITIYVPESQRLEREFASQLSAYIAQRYTGAERSGKLFGTLFDRMPPPPPPGASGADALSEDAAPSPAAGRPSAVQKASAAAPLRAAPKRAGSLEDMLRAADAGFSETLLKLIDESGEKDADVYKRANIDRKLFSKIRSNARYRPSKATALALAVALRLDLDGTRDLIGRAGYTLTHASVSDIIVEYFIVNEKYDIFELNETLFAYDQPLLGGA